MTLHVLLLLVLLLMLLLLMMLLLLLKELFRFKPVSSTPVSDKFRLVRFRLKTVQLFARLKTVQLFAAGFGNFLLLTTEQLLGFTPAKEKMESYASH